MTVRSDARYCSTRCRVAGNRAAKRGGFPSVMTKEDRWVRAEGKRPLRVDGSPAKSNDSLTWSSFDAVRSSDAGDGFGFMLGGGIGCYDFDDVSDDEARSLLALVSEPVIFVERSVSGRGVHVFILAPECAGSKKWQVRYERYTRERFILTTGNRVAL